MSTNHTVNYQLSQWEATDPVLRSDFNADNAKIDAALASQAAALAGKGTCQFWTTAYTGNGLVGSANARSITFPKKPKIAFVVGGAGLMPLVPGVTSVPTARGSGLSVTWNGNTVSWSGGSEGWVMMNTANTLYAVIALMDAAQ